MLITLSRGGLQRLRPTDVDWLQTIVRDASLLAEGDDPLFTARVDARTKAHVGDTIKLAAKRAIKRKSLGGRPR